MRDARATRRPANRAVELTVWDVLSLSFDEAPVGQFKEGQWLYWYHLSLGVVHSVVSQVDIQ